MRTTLTINDELPRKAKELATRRKNNVSATVNDVLQTALKGDYAASKEKKYRTIVYAPSGEEPKVKYISPAEMNDMLAAEEMEPYSNK
ncbi:MAG: hypothetical protein AAF065_06325 [Verrucomicrobiota bacterium]